MAVRLGPYSWSFWRELLKNSIQASLEWGLGQEPACLQSPSYGNICSPVSKQGIGPEKPRKTILTNKFDGFIEPGADIGLVVVLNRNTFVLVVVFKVVGAVGRDIYEGRDSQHVQHVFSGGMVGTA